MYKIFAVLTLIVAPLLALGVSHLQPQPAAEVAPEPVADAAPASPVPSASRAAAWSAASMSQTPADAPLPGAGEPATLFTQDAPSSQASAKGELVSPAGQAMLKE